ncbi:MAG: ABC transporter ATP-binding protein [Myxococcaceae bacterium]
MLAIEAAGLQKTYSGLFGGKGQQALCGVDLQVPRGAAFGLIGPNGAGKTTFIKTLLGVVRPTSGTVRVLGGDPEDPEVRRRIGYLPERLHLPSSWTPRPFLASVARLKGLSPAGLDFDALLSRVGLGPEANRDIGGFSKGMRQRLGLASALLGSPELLVLDEPTDGIDPLGRVELRRVLAEEVARGATLFLNSHLLAETERVCGRIGILAKGRLLREGPLAALCRLEPRWTARFAPGADGAALACAGFTPAAKAGAWRCDAKDPAELNLALDRARAGGAQLVELLPDELDLEEVLTGTLGAAS